jgi:DinB superfamily
VTGSEIISQSEKKIGLRFQSVDSANIVQLGERETRNKDHLMSSHSELIASYLAGVDTLKKSVAGMTPEQLTARPIPGKWSTLECVCHLSDFEPVLADRMKRIITHPKPLLMGADERLFAQQLSYHDRDLSEELAIVETTRKQMARILTKLPSDAWTRVGNHAERGLLTLEQMVQIATRHIPHHVQFIAEKRKALGV